MYLYYDILHKYDNIEIRHPSINSFWSMFEDIFGYKRRKTHKERKEGFLLNKPVDL